MLKFYRVGGVNEVGEDISFEKMRETETFWYLATPYTKYPGGQEEAFKLSAQAAAIFIRHRVPIFAPIAHTHPIAEHGGLALADYTIWLPADAPFIRGASGIIVVMAEGWETSYGVKHEREAFARAGKPEWFLPWPFQGE